MLAARTVAAMVALGVAFSFDIKLAAASDTVTEDQILHALTPPPKPPLTRGLSNGPPIETSTENRFLETIRGRTAHSLSGAEREEIATIVRDRPKIDLEIKFDYNSAHIGSKSLAPVKTLGKALANPGLKDSTFIIAVYTDAAGSDFYNQDLSERRAEAIKRYLTEKYRIAGGNLVTVGYGRSKPKDPNRPMADVNRRVQVVNMANRDTASK
jgi:outer membrane protein OmpA-like peptidoglycan-associated protein